MQYAVDRDKSDSRAHCNGKLVEGVGVFYKAKDDKGQDKLVLDVDFKNGTCAAIPRRLSAGSFRAHARISSLNCQTATSSAFSLRKFPQRVRRLDFRGLLPKRGSGAPYGATILSVVPLRGSTCQPCDGQPRLTALHCGVFKPWGHSSSRATCAWKCTGLSTRGCLVSRGASQSLPGPRLRIVGAGTAPHSALSFALQSAPQRMGMRPPY